MHREQAVINLPINDYFKLRFGIDHQARDGYVRNVTGIGADDLNDVDYTAGRLSMVLNLTDDIENYTILSYVHSRTNGNTASLLSCNPNPLPRSEEHTSELQSLMRISYAVFCLKKKKKRNTTTTSLLSTNR